MGRLFDAAANGKHPLNIKPEVVARYVEDKASGDGKLFWLLKEWVSDTTCANVTVAESHRYTERTYADKQYGTYTKLDMEIHFHADTNPAGRQRLEFLCKNSPTMPHPDFPKRKEMRLYKVLNSIMQGVRKTSDHETDLKSSAGVVCANSASTLMETAGKRHNEVATGCFGDFEAVPAPKRDRKEPTEEEIAQREARAKVRQQMLEIKKHQKDIRLKKDKLEELINKLQGVPDAAEVGNVMAVEILKKMLPELSQHEKAVKEALDNKKYEDALSEEGCIDKYEKAKSEGALKSYAYEVKMAQQRLKQSSGPQADDS